MLEAFRETKVLLSLLLKYIISTRFHLQFIEWSTYNSMLYKNCKLTKKIFRFFTLANFREAHRVIHQDKQRALEYFENHAVVYSKKVIKGPLSLLRNIERNAVLKFAKLDEPGARVNLYSIQWLESKALVYGLHLMNHAKPLPTNLVALFERPRTDIV